MFSDVGVRVPSRVPNNKGEDMNLIVTPDTADEVTLYVVTDEIYTIIIKIYDCHEKYQKNNPISMKNKIIEDIIEILEDDDNVVQRVFAQTFCEEVLNWKYEIKNILCIPVW